MLLFDLLPLENEGIKLPLLLCPIPAGFPSPADDFIEDLLDLQALLIRHPSATDLYNAESNALNQFGIFQNDILIIDSSLKPSIHDLVVAIIDGELISRQLNKNKEITVQGVITYSLRNHYNKEVKDVSLITNLKTLLINNTSTTFLARAEGDSLIGAGVFDKDILIIDRSLNDFHRRLVVAAINGEFLVKRFDQVNGLLLSENPDYPPFDVQGNPSLYIEGIITFSIRSHYWK